MNKLKITLLEKSWAKQLKTEFEKDYITSLDSFLETEINNGKLVLPEVKQWFNALNSTPLSDIKVVILGQDPYPTPGHAHGLCFSVQSHVQPIPKSLSNIYKELKDDLGIEKPNGNLQQWANQGILLLNTVLTVESGQANAHKNKGWECLTDKIISLANDLDRPIAFVLWGAKAQKKGAIINRHKHLVIQSPHPSPLSSYRGFFGSKPFSQVNHFLKQRGQPEIDWSL